MSLAETLAARAMGEQARRTFRPLVLAASHEADRTRLEALLSDGAPTVIDTLEDQLLELMELRDPTPKPAEVSRARARAHLGDTPPEVYGTWAYYPWSRRLVHLLPEDEFREVRTGRNRWEITPEEQARLGALRVGIAGLSVGHATALTLALEGIGGELRLADFDSLGLSNLNRLRTGVHHLGLNKAVLCAREISELNPYLRLEVLEAGVTDQNVDAFLSGASALDLLIEECDDLYMKVLLREKARALGIPVLMETSDRGLIDIERFDREPDRPLFHGRIGEVRAASLRGLRTADKVPFVLRIVDLPSISTRLAASLVEIDRTIATWPQLGSAVCLGGAINADTARRVALGELRESGRFYVDLAQIIRDPAVGPNPSPARPTDPSTSAEPALSPSNGASAQGERNARVPSRPMREILEAAIRAPSGGNSQPWRFEIDGRRILCRLDPKRAATFLDFLQWASWLALGAAAENASLEAAALGFPAPLQLREAGEASDLAWTLTLPARKGEPVLDPLRPWIPQRVTNRKLGSRAPLDAESRDALGQAAAGAGGRLELLEAPGALDEIGAVLGEGERLRIFHERMHHEMMGELRWSAEEAERTKDGLALPTLELSASDEAGIRVASRWDAMRFSSAQGLGEALMEPTKKSIRAASAVGLLTFPGRDSRAYLKGGRCLERVWLTARASGLAFQPMSSLPYLFARWELDEGRGFTLPERERLETLRRRWRALFSVSSGEAELMSFRLARAPPPTARSARRPLEEVLTRIAR